MPTLILPPRYTPDSIALSRAAATAGWRVERLPGWRVPDGFSADEPVLYGEPLFASVVADALGVALLAPDPGWLTELPEQHRRRSIAFTSAGEARLLKSRGFIKPADDKHFTARVYESGAELPDPSILPDAVPVLVAEPVSWEVEFRCFVLEGSVVTISPYWREGALAQDEGGEW